ncbi:MAG: nucleotide exchange factor GrpE [Gemmataceae bacterium]
MSLDEAASELPLVRLAAELIALRERTDRQHKIFEQELSRTRDELGERFTRFIADVQSAYQQLRDELTGEKRFALMVLNELLDRTLDLERLVAASPGGAAEVSLHAAREALARFGVNRFAPERGDHYRPELHERVGTEKADGLPPDRILRVMEPGYAAGGPERLLRRALVIISE